MVVMINKMTGGDMLVAEDRVEEYLKAGHKRKEVKKPAEKKKKK